MKREELKAARELAKKQKQIETQKNQRHVKEITISIEWHKSRTWGSNPKAEAKVEYYPIEGKSAFDRKDGYTCSGCGYDKESTVIAKIFNDFLLYKLWEPKRPYKEHLNGKEVDFPYGVYMPDYLRAGSIPMYCDGIGTSCYYRIAKFIGGKFEHVASGKMFDVYKYTDMEA